MVFHNLAFRFRVTALVMFVTAAAAFAQSWNFTIEGKGPSPAEYWIYPPGASKNRPLAVLVDDVVESGGTCNGLQARLHGADLGRKGSSTEVTVFQLEVMAPEAAQTGHSARVLSVEVQGEDLTSPQAGGEIKLGLKGILKSKKARDHLWPCLRGEPEDDGPGASEESVDKGTAAVILAAVRQALPRTFDGMLSDRYGFSGKQRHVDLVPGMRLCVEYGSSLQRRNVASIDDLVGAAARLCFPVGHRQTVEVARGIGFDGFLDRLEGIEARTKTDANGMVWTAGALELSDTLRTRAAYRLFWPKAPDRYLHLFPDEELAVDERPLLVGAGSAGDMERITECVAEGSLADICEYTNRELKCLCKAGDADCRGRPVQQVMSRPVCHLFREWGVPVPEISVRFQSQWIWVTLGTTLLDLLERTGGPGAVPMLTAGSEAAADARAKRMLGQVKIKRRHHGVRRDVKFDDDVGLGALYLPLMHGDEIKW